MKLLLYCAKAKPYLYVNSCVLSAEFDRYILSKEQYYSAFGEPLDKLNGKIVGECDYEIEKMGLDTGKGLVFDKGFNKESQLKLFEIAEYIGNNYYYAIHIKNLKVFDEPKELSDYYLYDINGISNIPAENVRKAPQNMMRVFDWRGCDNYILVSIHPKWLYKILNGEKTIEIRKKVLKEMVNKEPMENDS